MRPDPIPARDEIQAQEAILCRIPVFRPVAIRLLRLMEGDERSALEVADLLNRDPALAAEVLTLANSAAYGTYRRIDTIARAIVMIGSERTKALATKAALDGMRRSIGDHPAVEACWAHSRATAVIAEWLAPFYRMHPDRVYTAGLLHDIGRFGLLALNSGLYTRLLESADGTNQELLAAERAAFRVDHGTAGLWLIKTWALPEEFAVCCARHHDESRVEQSPVADLVRLACGMAQAIGSKVAPLVSAMPIQFLLDEIPDQARPNSPRPLTTLALRLQAELGAINEGTLVVEDPDSRRSDRDIVA